MNHRSNRMLKAIQTCCAFMALFLVSTTASAAVPYFVNYQGYLTALDGTPLDTTVSITFRIYPESWSVSPVWDEIHSVTVVDGLYEVQLGETDVLPQNFFDDASVWLGVQVGTNSEMSPRIQFAAVPYAYRIGTIDEAAGGTITGDVVINGKLNAGGYNSNDGTIAIVLGAFNIASGNYSTVGGGKYNRARGDYSVVAGGGGADVADSNSAYGEYSAIGGGRHNSADLPYTAVCGGLNNRSTSSYAFIGGGHDNRAGGSRSVVVGGSSNSAPYDYSTIGGGQNNYTGGLWATVGGGKYNRARGDYSVVAGGGGADVADSNSAVGDYSAIVGGYSNIAEGLYATIGGGGRNRTYGEGTFVGGGFMNNAVNDGAFVGGGGHNWAGGRYSVIGGGGGAEGDSNMAMGDYSVIGGGQRNWSHQENSTISGGSYNQADSAHAVIGGGLDNRAIGRYSTIGGGQGNEAAFYGTVAGGDSNIAGIFGAAGGGRWNKAEGWCSMAPGGEYNRAYGQYSFAAGRRARAMHDGDFRWADATNADFTGPDTVSNSFAVRASGGVWFFTNTALTSGTMLFPGSSVWNAVSDSTKKRRYGQVDTKDLLNKVAALPIERWSYKTQDESVQHIGPMAQDFWNQFHVGDDSLMVSTIDPAGVALAAIQELAKQNREMQNEIMSLRSQIQSLMAGQAKTALEVTHESSK